ncbi:MAG: cupin domain-containing protein [Beijerinckiaceae bacterium]
MTRTGNLFADLPAALEAEQFTDILARQGVRIERIVSTGQASPPGFWYDQPQDEWVCVMSGAAAILIDGEAKPRVLRAGDWLELPAHVRHRVEWTDPTQPTVWLAVHVGG